MERGEKQFTLNYRNCLKRFLKKPFFVFCLSASLEPRADEKDILWNWLINDSGLWGLKGRKSDEQKIFLECYFFFYLFEENCDKF